SLYYDRSLRSLHAFPTRRSSDLYFEIKKQHPNEILFYRVGDFYEMFYDDALTASRELELTLTGKNCGKEERAPMCKIPFHSYERSEEHTSELQSRFDLVCRLLLE